MELPSTKPYLLRAIWEWCCDNGFTPYIAVQVDARTNVPREFIRDNACMYVALFERGP